MTRELRELLQELEDMKKEVRTLMGDNKVDEAEKRMEDVRALQKKIELQRELEEQEARSQGGKELKEDGKVEDRELNELEKEYTGVLLRAIRRRPITSEQRSIISEYEKRAVMNEGNTDPAIPDGDVGMVVPQDIQTTINQLMREYGDLAQYVNIQNVSTLSGSRVLEKDEDMTPLADVDEYGEIQEMDNPKFTPITYKVKKRAGYLPLTNELLADNDANLLQYVTNWIARKAAFTRSYHIINLLKTLTSQSLADVAAINTVLNVDLDPAISANAILLTNQDGFNWLDNQVDGMGRPILQEDITQPGRRLFKGRQVVVAPNRLLASDNGNSPIFIGDTRQFEVLFNRRFFELASTTEGGDAWRRDTTELRVIMRDDHVKWDENAVVYGQVDVSGNGGGVEG